MKYIYLSLIHIWVLLCLLLAALLILMVMRMGYGDKLEYDRERNLKYSDQGAYGTSGFMTEDEMGKVLELIKDVRLTRGIILGKLDNKAVCLPEKTRMNRNIAVYGASGSMKSRAFVRNLVSVSYTHLDVYKRQSPCCLL